MHNWINCLIKSITEWTKYLLTTTAALMGDQTLKAGDVSYFASRARAMIPAAIGAEADVPV